MSSSQTWWSTSVPKGFNFFVASYRYGLGLADLMPDPSGLKSTNVTKEIPWPERIAFGSHRWSTNIT
ncbi:MAG: hypothetical protein ACKPKO_18485, partial [Candidatus Fonsibacter sp.]